MTHKSDDSDRGDESVPDDGVGYGKPPRQSRFKPGQSGNPKGRPKGARNASTAIAAALRETVTVSDQGRKRKITKLEAAAKQLINKAAQGDLRAIHLMLGFAQMLEDKSMDDAPAAAAITEDDQRALNMLFARLEGKETKND